MARESKYTMFLNLRAQLFILAYITTNKSLELLLVPLCDQYCCGVLWLPHEKDRVGRVDKHRGLGFSRRKKISVVTILILMIFELTGTQLSSA